MLIKGIVTLLVVAAVAAENPLRGVDPNTLTCDKDGLIYLLLPHFEDCNKFYMCVHGEEVEFSCASDTLVFDFELQGCNYRSVTECVLRKHPDEEGSGAESNELGGEGSGEGSGVGSNEIGLGSEEGSGAEPSQHDIFDSEEEEDTKALPVINEDLEEENTVPETKFTAILDCRNAESASLQVAYIGDCQRFWRCENDEIQSFYCFDGLFFNPRTRQCDFEANVQCSHTHEDELKGEFMLYQ